LLELLLLAAVLADPTSLAQIQASRILKLVVEGDNELVDEYAEDFRFSEHFTAQMIAAFPVFCTHRYRDLDVAPWPEVTVPLLD
jgi:hypothetical protein